jgi:hypothetical protein
VRNHVLVTYSSPSLVTIQVTASQTTSALGSIADGSPGSRDAK